MLNQTKCFIQNSTKHLSIALACFLVTSQLFTFPALASYDREASFEIINTFGHLHLSPNDSELGSVDAECSTIDELGLLLLLNSLSSNTKAALGLTSDLQVLLSQFLIKPKNNTKFTDYYYEKVNNADGSNKKPFSTSFSNSCKSLESSVSNQFRLNEKTINLAKEVAKSMEIVFLKANLNKYLNEFQSKKAIDADISLPSIISAVSRLARHEADIYAFLDDNAKLSNSLTSLPESVEFLDVYFPTENRWSTADLRKGVAANQGSIPQLKIERTTFDGSNLNSSLRLFTSVSLSLPANGNPNITKSSGVSLHSYIDLKCPEPENRKKDKKPSHNATDTCIENTKSNTSKMFTLDNQERLFHPSLVGNDVYDFLTNYGLSGFDLKLVGKRLIIKPKFQLYFNESDFLTQTLAPGKLDKQSFLEEFKSQLDEIFKTEKRLFFGKNKILHVIDLDVKPQARLLVKALVVNQYDGLVYELTTVAKGGSLVHVNEPVLSPPHLFISNLKGKETSPFNETNAKVKLEDVKSALIDQGRNPLLARHLDISLYKKECYLTSESDGDSCDFVNLNNYRWISNDNLKEIKPNGFKGLGEYLRWVENKHNLLDEETKLYEDFQKIVFDIDSVYSIESKASYSKEQLLALERQFFTVKLDAAIFKCLNDKSEVCEGSNINKKLTDKEKLVRAIFKEYCTSILGSESHKCTITNSIFFGKLKNWWQEKVKDDEALISLVDFDAQIIKSPDCNTRNSVELILNSQTIYLYPRSTENSGCVDGVPTVVDAFYKPENADQFEYLTSIPFYFFQVKENKVTRGSIHLIKNVLSTRLKALHHQVRFKEELYATTALHIQALKNQFYLKTELNLKSLKFPELSNFENLIAESNLFFLKAINENIESFLKTGENCFAQSSSQNCLEFTANLSTKSKYKFLIFSPSNLLMVEEKEESKLSSNKKGNFDTLPKEQLFTSYLKITPPKLVQFSTSVTDSADKDHNEQYIGSLNNLFSTYKLDEPEDSVVTEFNLPKSFEIRIVDIKENTISIEADSRKLEIRNCELSKIHSLLGKFSKVNRCIAVDASDETKSLWRQLNKINKFKLAGHYKLLDLKKEISSYEEYTAEPELQQDLEELEKELKKRKMIWDSITNFINEPMPPNSESVYDIFNTISKFYLSVLLPIIRGPCDFDLKPKMLAALNEVGYFSDGNPQLFLPRLVCDVKYDSEGKNIESSKVNLLAFNLFDSKETTISKELTSDLFTSNSTNPLDNSAFIKLNNFYYSLLDNACIKVNDKASECKHVTYSSDWRLLKEYLELENVEFKFKKEGEQSYAYAVAHINDKATPLFFYDRNTIIQHLRKTITNESTAGLIMPTKAEINFSINYWAKESQSYLLSDAALLKQIYGVEVTPELEKLEEDYSAFIEKKELKETFKDYLYRKFELEIKEKAIKEAETAFRELFTKEEFDKLTKEQRALNWSSDSNDPPTTIVLASCPLFDFQKDEKGIPIRPLKYGATVDKKTNLKISVKDFLEKPNRIFDNCHENYRKLFEALISSVLNNYDSEFNEDKLKTKLEALLSKELPLNQQEGIGWLKLKPMSLVKGNPYALSELEYSLHIPNFKEPCKFSMANSLDKIAVNLAKLCIKPYIDNLVNYDKVVDKVIRPIVGVAEGLINCEANDKNRDLLAYNLKGAKIGFRNNKFYFERQNCNSNDGSYLYYLHPETFLDDEAIKSYLLSNNLKLTDTVKEFQSQLGKIVNEQVKVECFSSELKKTNCDEKVEIIALNYLGKELQISTKQIERSLKTQLSGAMVWYLSHVSGFPESVIGCNALTCELNISNETRLTFDVYNDFSSLETLYSKIAPALLQQVNEVKKSINLPNDHSVSVDCKINTGCSIKLISSDSVYTLRPVRILAMMNTHSG